MCVCDRFAYSLSIDELSRDNDIARMRLLNTQAVAAARVSVTFFQYFDNCEFVKVVGFNILKQPLAGEYHLDQMYFGDLPGARG